MYQYTKDLSNIWIPNSRFSLCPWTLETFCWQLILPSIIPPSALRRQDSPFFCLQKTNATMVWPDDLRPLCDKSAREAGTSVHPGARGKVLVCRRPRFLSLFSPRSEISSNEFLSPDNRPNSGSHPSGALAFIVLVGLSEGHLTLFHLQMLTDPALALITPQAWPFHLHQGHAPLAAPRRRSCLAAGR